MQNNKVTNSENKNPLFFLRHYVQPGPPGTGNIIINGGAAHRIKKGERVAIMAFALSEQPVAACKALLNDKNEIIRGER